MCMHCARRMHRAGSIGRSLDNAIKEHMPFSATSRTARRDSTTASLMRLAHRLNDATSAASVVASGRKYSPASIASQPSIASIEQNCASISQKREHDDHPSQSHQATITSRQAKHSAETGTVNNSLKARARPLSIHEWHNQPTMPQEEGT